MKKAVKIILIIVGIIFLLFAVLVGIEVVEQQKLDKIVSELNNQDEIDMTIKMKGSYGIIEKMIKNDYKRIYDLADKILTEYDNPIIEKCLSVDTYRNDGPDFLNTRKELNELKENRKKITDQMLESVSDKEANKRVKEYKLDEFDAELYLKYVGQLKIYVDEAIDEDKKLDDVLDSIIAVLDFLGENKDGWKVEEELIVFNNQDLLDKYNWLLDKIDVNTNDDEIPTA